MTGNWLDLKTSNTTSNEIVRVMFALREPLEMAALSLASHRMPSSHLLGAITRRGQDLHDRCRFLVARVSPDSEDGKRLAQHRSELAVGWRRARKAQAAFLLKGCGRYKRYIEAVDLLSEEFSESTVFVALSLLDWDEINAMELLGRMAE